MKILLEFTTINYKMWHSLAKRLQEIYPGSRFAGILGFAPGGDHALEFLTKQTDVKYEFIRLHHEIMKEAFDSEIDFNELRRFEKSLSQKSLWRVIAADRGLGSQFMHGAIWKRTFINQNATYENILRVFSGLLGQFRTIFEKFQPDLFLPAIAMGGVGVFIFEQICKERNIPYIVPSNVRVKNMFAFSADVQLRFPQIDDTYKKLFENKINIDISNAEKIYDELMIEIESPQYFDRINSRFNIIKFNSFLSKIRLIVSAAKLIVREVLNWQNSKILAKSGDVRRQPEQFSTLIRNILMGFQFLFQKVKLTNPEFYAEMNPNQKYIYYPLHINPEYSTQIQGTIWVDQIHLIELLAKSIPFDWKVYVKEHPGTLIARTRPSFFYKKISRLPNVCLVPIDSDMHRLISNAEMVAVITGTSGWEAIQRGKPVITFADNMWDVTDLSKKCTNVETLSEDIYCEVERIKKMPQAERKRRIITLIASMLMHSFNVTYPNELVYTEMGTDEKYETVGREVADALKSHIEYLQEKMGYKIS